MSLNPDAEFSAEEQYDPFARGELARVAPVTPEQQELWLSVELGGTAANLAYNQALALTLKGHLDVGLLSRCLNELVQRHEALRTSLSGDGTKLCVAPTGSLELCVEDLSGFDVDAKTRAVEAARARAVEREFCLVEGPFVRAELLRLSADEHVLFLVAHHIVCDGTSLNVLTNELATLYSAYRRGEAPELPAPTPFCDYAELRASEAESAEAAADLAYWKALYARVPEPLDLALDFPRPPERKYDAARLDVPLDPELVRALRAVAARCNSSLTALLFAAFQAYLARLTGRRSFVVVLPASGQALTGKKALVGHCVRTLPFCAEVALERPFTELLERVKASLLDALEHPRITVGELIQHLSLPRDPSRVPLSGIGFNVDSNSLPKKLPELSLKVESLPHRYESLELFVSFAVEAEAITLEVCYNTSLYARDSIDRRVGELVELLRDVGAHPEKPVEALRLMTDEEALRLVGTPPALEVVAPPTVCATILSRAKDNPEQRVARSGTREQSYGELDRSSLALAHRLVELGAGPGRFVGVYLPRSVDLLTAILGVLRAGAAYVPLDPEYPKERLDFIVEDTHLTLAVTSGPLLSRLPRGVEPVLVDCAAPPVLAPFDASRLDDQAYVIFTSGSTGTPKGVVVQHSNLATAMASMAERPGIGPSDVVLSVASPCFDMSIPDFFLPLCEGAEVVIAEEQELVDGHRLAELIARAGITWMQATPAGWRVLLESGWGGQPGLKAISAGDALTEELARELAPRVQSLWNGYGPTETTIFATFDEVGEPPLSIGQPARHVRVYVLDAQRRLLPEGVVGELYIGGAGVTLGYHERPELNRERFFSDPFASTPGARMYKTGDLGRRRSDGRFEWLGRNDQQVKVRGYRIEPGEIEAALRRATGVEKAVVMVREDRPDDQRLVGYVCLAPDAALNEAALRAELRARLPAYMVPHHLVFLDDLPLGPSGKVDRKALPAPERSIDGPGRAPETELERELAQAFTELLGVERVGIDDDFFALGGHSLLALRLVAKLRASTSVDLPVRVLFANPTVKGLSEYLEAAVAMQRSSGVQSTDGWEREELIL